MCTCKCNGCYAFVYTVSGQFGEYLYPSQTHSPCHLSLCLKVNFAILLS